MGKEKITQERNVLYKEQFDILSSGSTEYPYLINHFRTEIFPTLRKKERFLDIGCGRGNLARPLSADFDQTTVIEMNPIYYDEVLEWGKANGRNINGYNGDWAHVDLDAEVDFALMSHMLYYVDPPSVRPAFIRKAYDLVRPGGMLVIILNAEVCGIRHVYQAFFPQKDYDDMPSGPGIAAILRAEGYPNVEEITYPAIIETPTKEAMGLLVDFMLLRLVSFDTEEKIAKRSQYIDEYLTRGEKFIMDSEGTMVVLRKP
jgi:SAM-dependent methyltransferase